MLAACDGETGDAVVDIDSVTETVSDELTLTLLVELLVALFDMVFEDE